MWVQKIMKKGRIGFTFREVFRILTLVLLLAESASASTLTVDDGTYKENILLAGGAAWEQINSCREINSAGKYLLSEDIWNAGNQAARACIRITSNDVVLDGADHFIVGNLAVSDTIGVFVRKQAIMLSNITVNNLHIENFDQGIFYDNTANGVVANNSVKSNREFGIHFNLSNNGIIENNNVTFNERGIRLLQSHYIIIKNNKVSKSNRSGIKLNWTSTHNKIINNIANNNDKAGIELDMGSSFNNITNNLAGFNKHSGIGLRNSSIYNDVFDNNVSNNDKNGIVLAFASNYNNIGNNSIKMNLGTGIFLDNSSENSIHNNYFNNTNNAIDIGNRNIWNISKTSGTNIIRGSHLGGNFWSDYAGKDIDGDGLGDTLLPYNSSGNISNGGDMHPLVFAGEDKTPISICGPDKLKCENVGAPVQFNGSASYDPDGAIASYYWDFGDGANGTGVAPKHTYATYRWNGSAYLPFNVNLAVTDNNGLTNGTSQKVVIWMAGDVNGDGKVNILDASLVGIKWSGMDPCADLNNDGKVNILDASIIGLNWGKVPIVQ